jgi:hypothetical protein
MTLTNEGAVRSVETPIPDRYDSVPGLKEAAREVISRREEAGIPEPQLHAADTQPMEYEGEANARNNVERPVSVSDAGKQLADWRRKRDAQAAQFDRDVLGTPDSPPDSSAAPDDQTIDEAKAYVERFAQEQPEAWEQMRGARDDELAEQAQRARELNDQAAARLAEIERATAQASQSQVEAVKDAYRNDFYSKYPEWADPQYRQVLAQNDPAEFQQIAAVAQQYEAAAAQALAVPQAQQVLVAQAQQQRWAEAAKVEDERFNEANTDFVKKGEEYQKAVRAKARALIRERFGATDEQIDQGYFHGVGPLAYLRLAGAQQTFLDAAETRSRGSG